MRLPKHMARPMLTLLVVVILALAGTGLLPSDRRLTRFLGAQVAHAATNCESGTKAANGTVLGYDGRAVNAQVSIDAVNAAGQRLNMDGTIRAAATYTATLRLNATLPPEGRDPGLGGSVTWQFCLPANTHHAEVEVYSKNQSGVTTQTRYGNARRPLPSPGPWEGIDLRLPLVCAADPVNGTGMVRGRTFAAGVPVLATRGPAWALGPNFQGIWGFAGGSYFTAPNSYVTQQLAPRATYDLRITYHNMTTRRTDVRVGVCATTTLNLDYIGDGLPNQTVVRLGDGRAMMVARGGNELLYRVEDPTQRNGWRPWRSLGGNLTGDPSALVQADGRVLVFARTAGNAAAYIEQVDAAGTWGRWTTLAGVSSLSKFALVNDNTDLPEVFVRGLGNHVYRSERDAAGAWGAWEDLGGSIATEPVAVRSADGTLELFAVQAPSGAANDPDAGSGPLVSLAQTSAGGPWGAWDNQGGRLTVTPTLAVNNDGSLDAFSRWVGGTLWHNKRSTRGSWGGWNAIGKGMPIRQGVAVGVGPSGRLKVFGRGNDDQLYRLTNRSANSRRFGSWSLVTPSTVRGGVSTYLDSPPALGVSADGRMVISMRSASGTFCQTSKDGRTFTAWTCDNQPRTG
jgi:hypothetical protein